MSTNIRPRVREAILAALGAGVVPLVGLQHIQVGRVREVEALLGDLQRVADGGGAFRVVIGTYGSGKTFFTHLVRMAALEQGLVTLHADLTPERRLAASDGKAQSLYAELLKNLATKTRPEGGGLAGVVERFIGETADAARRQGQDVETQLQSRLEALSELVGGFDFGIVVRRYWQAHQEEDEATKFQVLRWLRGEFTRRTEAMEAVGVRTIVEDANWLDQLKLLARFVRLAGYTGLWVSIDEMINLYKLSNPQVRANNYELLLTILNDCLQGNAEGLGFLFGGTPEFLLDARRGLYSYPALQSRLGENRFATGEMVDLRNPVIRLLNLTAEDYFVLLTRIRQVHAQGDEAAYLLPDEALQAFIRHCGDRFGPDFYRAPRNTVTSFMQLLSVLEQHPGADWRELIGEVLAADAASTNLPTPPSAMSAAIAALAAGDHETPPTADAEAELAHFTLETPAATTAPA